MIVHLPSVLRSRLRITFALLTITHHYTYHNKSYRLFFHQCGSQLSIDLTVLQSTLASSRISMCISSLVQQVGLIQDGGE